MPHHSRDQPPQAGLLPCPRVDAGGGFRPAPGILALVAELDSRRPGARLCEVGRAAPPARGGRSALGVFFHDPTSLAPGPAHQPFPLTRMKKLLLISPISTRSLMGGGFFFRIPCVSLLKVAALTPPGWEVTIIDEKVEPL